MSGANFKPRSIHQFVSSDRGFCPDENPAGFYWEYLSAKDGDDESWTEDRTMKVECAF